MSVFLCRVLLVFHISVFVSAAQLDTIITRNSFPPGFVFGTASSAYQHEGAVKEDGRGPCIWDKFAHTFGKVLDFSNADVTVDQYHRYKEDIDLMKNMGMDAYCLQILNLLVSDFSRFVWYETHPDGAGEINQAGVDHYNNLINALIAKGIEPYVTIYHWDLPQALHDKYNGWLSPQIINDYAIYAETLFKNFGDRVKKWITFNEPHNVAVQGYDNGMYPPGRCSILLHLYCRIGNSATEPYIVARNILLSHATVVDIYRNKYKTQQQGLIGASFDVMWYEPATNTTEDIDATQRAQDFSFGWFIDPLIWGDYPISMKTRVGARLPRFTPSESSLLRGSLDFVGINHYTTWYVRNNKTDILDFLLKDTVSDSGAISLPFGNDGRPIGDKANSVWLYIVPRGIRSLMNYIKNKYGNPLLPLVIITENGMDDDNNPLKPIEVALKDEKRIKYHHDYLQNLLAAIKEDGCNVKGYFAWSLLDNWEWAAGYTSRFGLYFVDFKHKLKRYPKDSVTWFTNFLHSTT